MKIEGEAEVEPEAGSKKEEGNIDGIDVDATATEAEIVLIEVNPEPVPEDDEDEKTPPGDGIGASVASVEKATVVVGERLPPYAQALSNGIEGP